MDFLAWWYGRRGWLPHRARKWAEVWRRGEVSLRLSRTNHIFTVEEARWLAAELLLAARDAEKRGPTE